MSSVEQPSVPRRRRFAMPVVTEYRVSTRRHHERWWPKVDLRLDDDAYFGLELTPMAHAYRSRHRALAKGVKVALRHRRDHDEDRMPPITVTT